MLDQDLKQQLKEVFSSLTSQIDLAYVNNNHDELPSLIEMLTDISLTAPSHIKVISIPVNSDLDTKAPTFKIFKNKTETGITFRGIPGGHEFTSLIVAILNVDGKGKLPDENIAHKIKSLKGPIEIKTYISLTCENCPDVVQALNQMSLVHPNFKHEMVDGGYFQDEINTLGIQGVPSIVVNGKMIHSGRIQLIDLISKLEETFGKEDSAKKESQNLGHFDVVVVGGGPAGASAAIYSARKGLKTALLAERMGGQVQDTVGIENLISVVYTEGPQLAAQLQKHIAAYPIQVFEHRRIEKIESEKNHKISLQDSDTLSADSIIIATGAKWRELNVPGEKEYIGRGVAYCPHCDGPYYKGKKVAVVGGGNSGVEAAIDLAGIVREVVVIEFNTELKADKVLVDKLKSLSNVSIITNAKTEAVFGDGQKVLGMNYTDRSTNEINKIDLDGVFVQIGLIPNSQFLKDTVELTKFGEIVVDNKGRTSTKGIYAAGDVTTVPYKQIIIAMGEGAKAALAAFEDRMVGGH